MKGIMMAEKNIIYSSILVCSVFFISCAGTIEHHYKNAGNFPASELPQKIYVGNQVEPLYTDGPLPDSRNIFVEVRTFEGIQEKGRLIQITEDSLIMSSNFNFVSENDSTIQKEHKKLISKDKILILKLW